MKDDFTDQSKMDYARTFIYGGNFLLRGVQKVNLSKQRRISIFLTQRGLLRRKYPHWRLSKDTFPWMP